MPELRAVARGSLAAESCNAGSGHQVTAEPSEATSTELLSKAQGAGQIKTALLQSLKDWPRPILHRIFILFLPLLSGCQTHIN